MAAVFCGCAYTPARPSTPAERTPTPGSITRDNPAGDAEAPADAAIARLSEQPLGRKRDRFGTLKVRLPDHLNWKRVRFWGHPTRAAFRYGKEGYAVAVLSYSDAEGDDSPRACLEHFVHKAARTATNFDVELTPITRELHKHYRGPESVDWVEHERLAKQRRAERKRKRAERRRKALERLPKLRIWRAKRRLALKRKVAVPTPASPGPQPESAPNAKAILPPPKVVSQPAPRDIYEPDILGEPPEPSPQPPGRGIKPPKAEGSPQEPAKPPADARKKRIRRLTKLRALAKRLKTMRRARRHLQRLPVSRAEAWRRHKLRWGETDMPVIRVSGQFDTILIDDQYLAAVAAYDSWPGTCLVQGFAVRVGSDETLAEQLIERWIREIAPKLLWVGDLREAPPFKNR